MTDDGFATSHPAYLMSVALKAQNPSISTWVVGRKANPSQQSIKLEPNTTVAGEVVRITVEGTEITYTILGSATTTTIAAAVAPLINAVSGVTASASGAVITVTPTVTNDLLSIGGLSLLDFTDNTPDPGIAADLAAVAAYEAEWYGLLIDSESETEIKAAASWAEANTIIFGASSLDSGCKDGSVATDVGSDLQTAGYARTYLLFSESNQQYGGARWMGKMFPKDPGSATWAYKNLAGLDASVLSATEEGVLDGKNINRFQVVGGARITQKGYSSSGEYIDITRGVDWFQARLQERISSILVNNDKLPFSDKTGDLIRAAISAQMQDAVSRDILLPDSEDTPQVIDVPSAASVSTAAKANRLWPDITFSAKLAGAVHTFEIQGSLSL